MSRENLKREELKKARVNLIRALQEDQHGHQVTAAVEHLVETKLNLWFEENKLKIAKSVLSTNTKDLGI